MLKFGNKETRGVYIGSSPIRRIYCGTDIVFESGGVVPPTPTVYPNNEIHYKSVDNVVIDSGIPPKTGDGIKTLSNEYVPALDHNVITLNGDLTDELDNSIGELLWGGNLKEFLWLPSTCTFLKQNTFNNQQNLEYIYLGNENQIESLPHAFMSTCPNLTKFDLSGLKNVKEIGTDCFIKLPMMEVFKFDFQKVVSIGDRFLSHVFGSSTSNVREVSFGDLMYLKTIGNDFLSWNPKLETVTFENLSSSLQVGQSLFSHCPSFKKLILKGVVVAPSGLFTDDMGLPSEGIYVPDNLVDIYRIALRNHEGAVDLIKPISELEG